MPTKTKARHDQQVALVCVHHPGPARRSFTGALLGVSAGVTGVASASPVLQTGLLDAIQTIFKTISKIATMPCGWEVYQPLVAALRV